MKLFDDNRRVVSRDGWILRTRSEWRGRPKRLLLSCSDRTAIEEVTSATILRMCLMTDGETVLREAVPISS